MTFLCSLTCQRRQEEGLLGPLVTDKDGEGRRAVDGEGPGEGRGVDGAEPGGEGGRGVDRVGPGRGGDAEWTEQGQEGGREGRVMRRLHFESR